MNLRWLYSISILLALLLLRVLLANKTIVVNPVISRADQSIFQLNEANNQLSTIISSKQIELNSLTAEVDSLTTTRDNLAYTLELAINNASTQEVIIEPVVQDPEIVLLVDLRTQLLTYMDANFVPTTIYVKSSSFYVAIDSMLEDYLNATTLTLTQFLVKFDDSRTVAFRQAIQQIYDTTTFYIFDSFYNQLSSP